MHIIDIENINGPAAVYLQCIQGRSLEPAAIVFQYLFI